MVWNRVSTFLACQQFDPACNDSTETVAEIVSATPDGSTLVYTDSPGEQIGFVDITDASMPMAAGRLAMSGEPTSVTITPDGMFALVAVNTSPNFTDPSGILSVVDIATQTIVTEIDIGGQPDSIAISSDGNYVAICMENERDEDLGDGVPPQMPAGFIWVIDTNGAGDPSTWTTTRVEVTNLADMKFPEDPEPEFVDINANNVAAITLQENNFIVLIDLPTATILSSYSAGEVDLTQIDIEANNLIDQTSGLTAVPREPDGAAWIGTDFFAVANEGDLEGGSRGFTIYALDGTVVYDSGNLLEHLTVRYGHYPEGRSDAKGNEPENILYLTTSDGMGFLAVNLERAGSTVVFSVPDPLDIANNPPVFAQILPTLLRPEGIVAVPGRDMFAVACEEDVREDKIRGGIVLFEYQEGDVPDYPVFVSADRADGTPIPFSALSGLSAMAGDMETLYAIADSAYIKSRMFEINVGSFPHMVTKEIPIVDSNGILAAAFPMDAFNGYMLVNDDDMTVNMDQEGIAASYKGGFWIANEGSGTVGDAERPVEMNNFIIKVDENGVVEDLITLPEELNAIQVRYGFEGVAEEGDRLVVVVQREWDGDEHPRIGIYDTVAGEWTFVYYPLDAVESPNGGWVGLSEISSLGGGIYLVLERDDQAGPDAAIKRLYQIEIPCDISADTVLTKTLVTDLLPTLKTTNGYVYEKIEGMTVNADGKVYFNNDNDGVDDNAGEQYMFELDGLGLTMADPLVCPTRAPSEAPPTTSPPSGSPPSGSPPTESPPTAGGDGSAAAAGSFGWTFPIMIVIGTLAIVGQGSW